MYNIRREDEDYLFKLCQICENVEDFKLALNRFEKNYKNNLDENNNLINNLNTQNLISNLRDIEGRTLLHYCVANNTEEQICCKYLLQKYPQLILAVDYQGLTIIHLAVINENIKLVKFLCNDVKKIIPEPVFRLLIQSADNELHTALHWAVVCQEYTCLDILIKTVEQLEKTDEKKNSKNIENNSFNFQDIHGATCLHYAAQMCTKNKFNNKSSNESSFTNSTKIKSNLNSKQLDSGMDDFDSLTSSKKNCTSTNNCSNKFKSDHSNLLSAKKNSLKILNRLLWSKQINVNCKDNKGRTPLLWAATSGENKSIRELLNAGSDVNSSDKDGLTALHCAASKGHLGCIETLLKYGNSDVNSEDKIGATPLHYAASFGSVDACKLLINHGSFVNNVDFKGRSVLHCAASKGQYLIFRALVEENEADIWKRNSKGELPLHDAVRSGHKELVKWILSFNQSAVNAGNNFGRTCLHIAAQANDIELCKLLIDSGASINTLMKQRNFNESILLKLDECSRKNYMKSTRRDRFGISMITPLDLALQRNFRSCARFLMMNGAYPAEKLGLKVLFSKSNPNLEMTFLDPDETHPTFRTQKPTSMNQNSPYSGLDSLITGENEYSNQPTKLNDFNIIEKQKYNSYNQQLPSQTRLNEDLPELNQENYFFEAEKRSHSQPMFANNRKIILQQLSNLSEGQLVELQPSSSFIDNYSVDGTPTRTQSIITNVYLNCVEGHHSHRIPPIHKKKVKLLKKYTSSGNLASEFNDLNQSLNHELNISLGNDLNQVQDALVTSKKEQLNMKNELKIKSNESENNSLNNLQTSLSSNQSIASEIKNLDYNNDLSSKTKLNKEKNLDKSFAHLNKIKTFKSFNQEPIFTTSSIVNIQGNGQPYRNSQHYHNQPPELNNVSEIICTQKYQKSDSRCLHKLHYKTETNTIKYNKDFSHIKAKIDTGNNNVHLKNSTNLMRSKSNIENLNIDELDEISEILQTSAKRYKIEKELLQELQNVKKIKTSANHLNEELLVKRLVDEFGRKNKNLSIADFCGNFQFKTYEKYLSEQLQKLSSSNEKKSLPLLNVESNQNQTSFKPSKIKMGVKVLTDKLSSFSSEKEFYLKKNENDESSMLGNLKETTKNLLFDKPKNFKSKIKIRSNNNEIKSIVQSTDYATTDENETLQDVSSLTEDKLNSMNYHSSNNFKPLKNANELINKLDEINIKKEESNLIKLDQNEIHFKNNEIDETKSNEKNETKNEKKNTNEVKDEIENIIENIIEKNIKIENEYDNSKNIENINEYNEKNKIENQLDENHLILENQLKIDDKNTNFVNNDEIKINNIEKSEPKINYEEKNRMIDHEINKNVDHELNNEIKTIEEINSIIKLDQEDQALKIDDHSELKHSQDEIVNERIQSGEKLLNANIQEQNELEIKSNDLKTVINNDENLYSFNSIDEPNTIKLNEDLIKETNLPENDQIEKKDNEIELKKKKNIKKMSINSANSSSSSFDSTSKNRDLIKKKINLNDNFLDKKNVNLNNNFLPKLLDDKQIIDYKENKPNSLLLNPTLNENSKRRLSIVKFSNLNNDQNSDEENTEEENKKRYVKTPIKKIDIKEELKLNELEDELFLGNEEIIIPENDKDLDESSNSLNSPSKEDLKEEIQKEKSDLIDSMDKMFRNTIEKGNNFSQNVNDKINKKLTSMIVRPIDNLKMNFEEKFEKKTKDKIDENKQKKKIEDKNRNEIKIKYLNKLFDKNKVSQSIVKQKLKEHKKEKIDQIEDKIDSNQNKRATKEEQNEDEIVDLDEKLANKKNENNLNEILNKTMKKSKIPATLNTIRKFEKNQMIKNNEKEDNLQLKHCFKRNCLKPIQINYEPLEQALNRPLFKRKKSEIPSKYSIKLNDQIIKKKWEDIKTSEKNKYYNKDNLRRSISNPILSKQSSNYYDLIYEINKLPRWARESLKKKQSNKSSFSNTNPQSYQKIYQTFETEKIKETKKIVKKTIQEDLLTTTSTKLKEEYKIEKHQVESKPFHEFANPSKNHECLVCRKIIIPIVPEIKFCQRDLRRMHSDSILEVKVCLC